MTKENKIAVAVIAALMGAVLWALFARIYEQSPLTYSSLVTDQKLTTLNIGEHVDDLIVETIRTEPRSGSIIEEDNFVTYVTFNGELKVSGTYDALNGYTGKPFVSDDYSLLFFTSLPDQLPFFDVPYVASKCIIFQNNSVAKELLNPSEETARATVLIEDISISYPETQACAKAKLKKVIELTR